METKKKALGKGLEQLFANNALDFNSVETNIVETAKDSDIFEINLDEIRSNPYQPRKVFDETALNELSESIKEFGVVQPVIVKKSVKGYELIAGERRCKASRLAGKETIPAIVKDFTDQEMMEIALLENVQREDLNPIEVAESINQIIKIKNMTQEDFAKKFGKSRSYVTNLLGILRLPDIVKKMVENKKLSMSHARLLSKLEDENKIIELAERILKYNISVHDLENLLSSADNVKPKQEAFTENFRVYERIVSDYFAEKVKISKNKIEIKFNDKNDLMRILNLMNVKVEED